jgi:UDP-N-acetylglucosamine 2-epimerase
MTVHSSPPARAANTHESVLDWLDEAGRILEDSRWALALDATGVSVWDALVSALYQEMLSIARDGCPEIRPSVRDRVRRCSPWSVYDWLVHRKSEETRAARQSVEPRTTPAVFWPALESHLRCQPPVAAALGARGWEPLFLVDRPRILLELRRRGLSAVFSRGAWPRVLRHARRRGAQAARVLERDPGRSLPGFGSAPAGYLLDRVRATIQRSLPLVFETIATFDQMREHLAPRVLVVGNDLTTEGRTAALRARDRGLPTACQMHGNVTGNPIQGRHVVDRFLLYGEASRAAVLEYGADPDRLVVTGAPYRTEQAGRSDQVDPAIARFLGLRTGQPWVLVATSGGGHLVSHTHHLQMIEAVTRLSAELPDVAVVAKLHPKDDPALYAAVAARIPESRLRVATRATPDLPREIWSWLQGCPLVLTSGSTVAIESMAVDVPVLTMDFADELSHIDFIAAGATTHVRDASTLTETVRRLLQTAPQASEVRQRAQTFVASVYASTGAEAARRDAQVLFELADGPGSQGREHHLTAPARNGRGGHPGHANHA